MTILIEGAIYKQTLIKKELSPKRTFWPEKKSLLNSGDGIRGEIIRGFSEKPFNLAGGVPGTSAHRAQGADTPEGRNFGELDRMYSAFHPIESQIRTPLKR